MRTYIFTEAEREALHNWLSGTLKRTDSPLLHTTLGRLRRSEKNLISDIRLFTLTARRLHLAPKLRRRTDDMDTTINLAPIPIHPTPDRVRAYITLIKPLNEAQTIANDKTEPTMRRLRATELAARMGAALINKTRDNHKHLVKQIEKLKQEPAPQS